MSLTALLPKDAFLLVQRLGHLQLSDLDQGLVDPQLLTLLTNSADHLVESEVLGEGGVWIDLRSLGRDELPSGLEGETEVLDHVRDNDTGTARDALADIKMVSR